MIDPAVDREKDIQKIVYAYLEYFEERQLCLLTEYLIPTY